MNLPGHLVLVRACLHLSSDFASWGRVKKLGADSVVTLMHGGHRTLKLIMRN